MEMQQPGTCHAPSERAGHHQIASEAALFAQRSLTRELLDAVPTLLAVLNPQRQIVFSNRALLTFLAATDETTGLGLRPGELFGCVNARIMPGGCGTAEACRHCGAVNAILAGLAGRGDAQEYRLTSEHQGRHEALDLRIHTTPFVHQEQQFVLFAIENLSHQKRRAALEHIFFHDILNLAGSVKSFSELLAQHPADPELPEILQLINSAASQIVDEIHAQRMLLAAENRELQIAPSTLNARALIRQAAEIYQRHPVAMDKDIRIDDGPEDLWFVSDAALLGRVLGNMTKNALEACRARQTVTLGCRRQDEGMLFWVHNPGVIPQQVQPHLFQRSFSTKGQGRGLGTYSMRLLTEDYLAGALTFTSSAENGTTFQAFFPLSLSDT
ncbi:sensor histidine kinase [Geoalkalibacter sp.]|uniref:sensor histidine kinase n=1 Tax=Geoalkalibacter sp. TaxID=3041440 RepID=UPI00272EBD8E|nr:HAMP domain-containing sensor histidine kinase [Geoalkalibacter sp.]